MSETSRQFFDRISPQYTEAIERCVPRYREMLWALLYYLPADLRPRRVLELGCGTGNLTAALLAAFPDAAVEAVDTSADLLEECAHRFEDEPRLRTVCADFRALERGPEPDDLVVSTIAIHHLTDVEKTRLFQDVYRWLRPGGVFAFSDQFAGETEGITRHNQQRWQELSREQGVPEEEWAEWMVHQDRHDHHASLPWHLARLTSAGFHPVDCPWRFLLWTVVVAGRPG